MDWTYRLRLRHLQLLLSLAETGNLSQSATALNTTQPALSKWLKELEKDVGLPLFERHARGLRPTGPGEALIEHARRIEAHLDTARDDMQALARQLVARGEGVLNMLFHSSEAIVGGSPYNRTQGELDAFFDRLERFFHFAVRELNATPVTYREFREAYLRH